MAGGWLEQAVIPAAKVVVEVAMVVVAVSIGAMGMARFMGITLAVDAEVIGGYLVTRVGIE